MIKLTAVVLLGFLLAAACRKPPAGSDGPPPAGEAFPSEEKPRQSITLGKVEPGPERPAPAVRPSPGRPPLSALELRERVMPEDFRIGALQDSLQDERARLVVLRAADRFLQDLLNGKINQAYLYPPLREELSRSLAYHDRRGLLPDRYRLGRVVLEEPGEARLPLRLFRGQAATEGDLYLSLWDGAWYVSDIQAGFEMLGQPRAAPGGKFMPPGRGW